MAGTILTNIGLDKLANATPLDQLNITHIAVGNGGGAFPPLNPGMTELVNEVWRGTSSNPIKDPGNANNVYFETNVPPEAGPFNIREIALFDVDGDMIAIGHTSLIAKPDPADDPNLSIGLKIFIALQNADDFDLIYQNSEVTSHNSLSGRAAENAHPSTSIYNEDGSNSQNTHDLVKKLEGTLEDFEVFDLNFSPPFRNELDYNISITGVLQTGQSLAEGGVGGGVVAGVSSVAFSGRTLMLVNGPMGLNNGVIGPSYTGLVENTRVTTAHSITKTLATGNTDKFIFSGQAWGGKNYNDLRKGGATGVYEKCITQVSNINSQVDSLIYEYITCIHGEQDGLDNNTSYSSNLNQWSTDFNSDIKAITGQMEDINMLICQTSTAGGYGFNGGIDELTFPTPIQQLLAHETYSNVTLVCPKYFLDYADHAHITNYSQRVLGEYYARAMKTPSYEPLSPSSFNIVGSSVVVTFKGNDGQLVKDTTNVNTITNSGFTYRDDASNTISSVVISGVNEITINLSGNPSTNAVLAYAYHNGSGGRQNQIDGNGDRGNIRDSSADLSIYGDGYNLYNWLVTFRQGLN